MEDEKELIQAITTKDRERYSELINRYKTGLIIHCENIIKDRDAAEDVAQDSFIKAYYKLNEFNPDKARFSTWLYTIATNNALNYLRKHKRQITIDDVTSLADTTMPIDLDEYEKQAIREAITMLEPPKYGDVIRAYFWDGKSYADIAKEYKTNSNTIGTWMRRAKAQLREKLV